MPPGRRVLIADRAPLVQEMRMWRRTIHAHPETAFEEHQTAELVARTLRRFGVEVHTGIAATGVVGVLRAGTSETCIGLRADMDALPMQELNTFEHRSRRDNRMHACGHDGHTAMLLGAAQYLSSTMNFDGTVCFIFQPAEENEGGGRRMIEEGLFQRFPMQAVYGLHNLPGQPAGRFIILPGPVLASFDTFEIEILGKGGHAGMPHLTIDPIAIGAQLVTALQTIVSRSLDPLESGVVSVTALHAGDTWNVVPHSAVLRGSVRAFDDTVQLHIERRIRELATGIAASFGATATIRYDRRYPATVNSTIESAHATEAARSAFGDSAVLTAARPLMASEDFAYMLREKPGCFALIGNGPGDGGCELHNPRYDFNDELLARGASYWVTLVEQLLSPVGGALARPIDVASPQV